MKKLHLNKIFHWLYALLMFMPFIFLAGYLLVSAFNPSLVVTENGYPHDLLNAFYRFVPEYFLHDGILSDVEDAIIGVFESLIGDDGDPTIIYPMVRNLFIYWTELSLIYLIFDVLMYPINLFHKWIDDGGI